MIYDVEKVRRGKKIIDIYIFITVLLTIGQSAFDFLAKSITNTDVLKNAIALIVILLYYLRNRIAFKVVMFFVPIWVLLSPGLIIFILLFGVLNYIGLMDIWGGALFFINIILSIIAVIWIDKKFQISDCVAEFKVYRMMK